MRTIVRYTTVLVLAMALLTPVPVGAAPTPLAVVEAYDATLNAGNVDAALALFADDATLQTPPQPGATGMYRGRAEMRPVLQGFVANNIRYDVTGPRQVNGDRVTWTNTHAIDPWRRLGIAPLAGTGDATVRDGKITSLTVGLTLESAMKLQAATVTAPVLTATPDNAAPGSIITVTGSKFAPNAALTLNTTAAVQSIPLKLADVTTGADGTFSTTFRVASFYTQVGPARPLPLFVFTPDRTELARASVFVNVVPSVAPEQAVVAPAKGAPGTPFTLVGTGFAPGATVFVRTTETALGNAGNSRVVATPLVEADGTLKATVDTTGYAPGSYDLVVVEKNPPLGFPLARMTFTVI